METNLVFETNDLVVAQGKFLKPIPNFSMCKGDIIHLRGGNGSGKTTLIKTLIGELKPHSGEIKNFVSKNNIIYLRQDLLHEIQIPINANEWLESFNALTVGKQLLRESLLKTRFSELSGGEKQKLSIIARINAKPGLLILDEPFNHVDAKSQLELLSFLNNLIEKSLVLGILFIGHQEIADFKVVQL